jgi:4-amino-4-deoxy-L-arabinose transferase-like glycosyltransferase
MPPALSRRSPSHPAALLVIALLTLPLLLLFLGTGEPVDMMELFNLVPVREAFRDHHWLMPTLNGVPRLEKPPLPVWIPAALIRATGIDSLWLLRTPSILLALLTGFATYGLGCVFFKNANDPNSRRYALLAAILLPTMLIFNRQARLASYDIFATGFLTCGAMFLAMLAEAERPTFWRWLGLTLGAGIATGLSVMSKGPVPVATVMLPLGLWLLVFHRRWPVWAGVAAAAIISVAVFFPWLWVIGKQYPEAWARWKSEFIQFGTGNAENPAAAGTKEQLQKSKLYYLAMLAWVAPLTPTVIGGLLLPFLPLQSDPQPAPRERRGRWLFWLVLVGGLLLLTVPSEKKPRYALQLFPFAALLCAAVWQEFVRLRDVDAGPGFPVLEDAAGRGGDGRVKGRKLEPAAAIMLAAQALCFIVPGLAGIGAVVWMKAGWPLPHALESARPALEAMARPWMALLFAVVAAGGAYLWHLQFRRRFAEALVWIGLCAWMLGMVGQGAYRLDPSTHTNSVHAPMAAALAAAGDAPIYTFPGGDARPWLSSLYFANRWMPELTAGQLAEIAAAKPAAPLWVMIVVGKGAEQQALALAAETGRQATIVGEWTDEGRHTVLLRLDPARAAATQAGD